MDRFHGDEPFIAAEQRRAESAVRAFIADPDQFDQPQRMPIDLPRIDAALSEVYATKTKIRLGSELGYDEIAGTVIEYNDEIIAALTFYRNNGAELQRLRHEVVDLTFACNLFKESGKRVAS